MKKHKASILAVTLITLSIILITALSVSLVAIKQKTASLGSGKSNLAFQNADTGVEEVMDKIVKYPSNYLGLIPGVVCSTIGSNNAVITSGEYKVELKKENYDPADAATYTNCSTTKAYEIASVKSIGTGNNQESRAIDAAVVIGPAQRARGYRNSSLTLTGGSMQKIPIDTESYDSSSILDTSTGRITPTIPGYYQVVGQASIKGGYIGRAFGAILKNSSEVSRGTDFTVPSGAAWPTLPVSDLIYFNGTSDYVELGAYVSANAEVQSSWVMLIYLSVVGPF